MSNLIETKTSISFVQQPLSHFPHQERIAYLDSLRAILMFLGIIFHGLEFEPQLSFLDKIWSIRISGTLLQIINTFRMPLFFAISGYLGKIYSEKKGLRQYLENRATSIFLPFIISFITIGLILNWLRLILYNVKRGENMASAWNETSMNITSLFNIPPSHLWFIYFLSIYVLTIFLFSSFILFTKETMHLRFPINKYVTIIFLFFLLPVIYNITQRDSKNLPWTGLAINVNYLLYFFYFFLFGWFIRSARFNLNHLPVKFSWFLVLAVILTCLKRALLVNGYSERSWLVSIIHTSSIWLYIISFIALSRFYFFKQTNISRYLSDASYWVYLIHYPILITFQILSYSNKSIFLFLFHLFFTLLLCLLSYEYFVRYTFIGTMLNGKRHRPEKAEEKSLFFKKSVV